MKCRWICGLVFALILAVAPARGALTSYSPDSATLHLWHLDETTVPCVDSAPGGTNLTYMISGATLGNLSYSTNSPVPVSFTNCASFGTLTTAGAVIFPAGSGNNGTPGPFTYAGTNGAFTFEAIVKVQWNPTNNYSVNPARNQPFQIMDCDADGSGSRVFQFRIDPVGFAGGGRDTSVCGLEFINGTTTIASAPIPTNGPDAIVSNAWYHLAVTYNGSAGTTSNLLFYWTLLAPTRTNADCIYGTNMTGDLSPATSATTVFSLGNSARNPGGGISADTANFLGNIDEVRISSIARPANDMVFVTTNIIILSQPAPVIQSVGPNQPFSISVNASGAPPLAYQWWQNNNPVSGANGSVFAIASAQSTNSGNYQVVIANGYGSVTSAVSTVTITNAPVVGLPSISPANNPIYLGTPVTLSATVSPPGSYYYFWQTDGGSGGALTNIPGANSNPYTFSTASMSPGTYQFDLLVSNALGSGVGPIATLNLAGASGPVLVNDTAISPSAAFSGATVLLSASFTGSQPINYQWYFNGTPVARATNSTDSIASVQLANAGSYYLMAWNNPPGLGWQTNTSTPATLAVSSLSTGPVQTNTVSGLFCELLDHPELTVITAQNPAFGWDYQPFFRNDFQTGYHLIVSSSQALSTAGTGDMWDSGLVLSSNSINVLYAGATLQPNTSYFWRVQAVDSMGQMGSLSAIQQFNTAGQLSNPLTTSGVIYQQPAAGSANCYPLNYLAALPVLVTNTAPGVWFVDFGQDAFGYATVQANGSFSGTNVLAGFGEWTNGNGYVVDTAPPATVRYGASTFTLGNGNVIYSVHPPSFNGKPDTQIVNPPSSFGKVIPFRYLELTNFPGTLAATDVVQERLMTEFDTNAASFTSSSPALNQVWNLCRNSMEWFTFDGIYVDGDRERTPYEADGFIHQMSSYAVDDEFTLPRCTFEYLTTHPTWPTEWKFHMIMTAWADYLQTGNNTLLNKYYSVLQQDSFTWAATGNGLMQGFPNFAQTTNSDIVDWPANDRDGFVINSGSYLNWTNSVNNAFYYHCLQLMANIATVTGHTNDAATYTADANQVYTAYNATFWNAASQCYVDGVGTTHAAAHANFFPLAFGLVPSSNQVAVINYLHSRIAANDGMPPSVYAAQYMLQGLFEAGDADTALDLIITNGPRSWMNMINLGSTLTDEAWSVADKSNEDWNHAWGAAAGNLIARYVLGLQPLTPGFGQILIQPQLGQTISCVQGVLPTIRGPVCIGVSNAPGQFQMLVNIPGNVVATVMLPAFGATNPVALVDGEVVSGSLSNNWLTVAGIGSGQHAIWLSTNSTVSSTMLYNNWASSWFGTNATDAAIAGPTANPDGNGYDNYYDFVTGTDPTNPNAQFLLNLSGNASNNLSVAVYGLAGRSYILQRTLNLSPAAWTGIVTNRNLSSNQTLMFSDPQPPPGPAFYRVLVTLP